MQTVRLKKALLIDTKNHCEGEVVRLADTRAASLIKSGFAEKAEGATEVANPDHNPLADAIQPCPPDGANASPEDAAIPTVQDNPGLIALETAAKTGASRRAAKVTGKATD